MIKNILILVLGLAVLITAFTLSLKADERRSARYDYCFEVARDNAIPFPMEYVKECMDR